jgi:hypothetical protein
MTPDDITRFAREAGLPMAWISKTGLLKWSELERFAALAYEAGAAAEREACAKVCEQTDEDGEGPDCWGWHAKDYAKAIRARSKE